MVPDPDTARWSSSEPDPSPIGRAHGMWRGLVRVIWGPGRERKWGEREAALSLYSRAGSIHNRHVVLSDRELHRNDLFTNFYWSAKTSTLNPCYFKTLQLGYFSVKSAMVQMHNRYKGDSEHLHQSPPTKSLAPYPNYCIVYFQCWTPQFKSVGTS